jgi:MFS family permease
VPGSLIHHRDFRLLWAGDTISQLGTQVTVLALPLLAVTTLHASPFQVGLLTTFEFASFLLVGLPAGAWVDRMRRRYVLIAGDIGRALLLGSLPLAAWLDVLSLPQLYAVALGTGLLTVFFDVAYQSYLPHLVGREHLVEGNAVLQASQSVSAVAGPTLGGFLVQALTAPYAVLVDAVSFLWSAGCVGAIRAREPRPERAPDRHLGREMKEGLAFVLGNRLLRAITACTATANLFTNVAMVVFVVLLAGASGLDLSAGTIGLLFSASAVGGVIGAVVARRFAGWVGQGPALWISIAVGVPAILPMPFVQRGWLLWLVAAGLVVWGATIVVYNITQVSFRQLLCPERLLGRMNATIRFAVWGTIPIGSLLGGILGATIGLRPTLWVAVIGSALAVLPVFLSPLRTMRELPTEYVPEGLEPSGPPVAGAVSGPAAGQDGGVTGTGGPTAAVAGERADGAP